MQVFNHTITQRQIQAILIAMDLPAFTPEKLLPAAIAAGIPEDDNGKPVALTAIEKIIRQEEGETIDAKPNGYYRPIYGDFAIKMRSDEYGSEIFKYDSHFERLKGLERLKTKCAELADEIERDFYFGMIEDGEFEGDELYYSFSGFLPGQDVEKDGPFGYAVTSEEEQRTVVIHTDGDLEQLLSAQSEHGEVIHAIGDMLDMPVDISSGITLNIVRLTDANVKHLSLSKIEKRSKKVFD